MRRIDVPEAFALKLARLRERARRKNLYQAPTDEEPRISAQDVDTIERELGIELPDPALAYVAAGVSLWGDGPVKLGAIVEATRSVRDFAVELGMTDAASRRFMVIDDNSNGDYIAVKKGTAKDSDRVYFLDHEGGFQLDIPLSLANALDDRLADFLTEGTIAPFRFSMVDDPAPAPKARTVSHPKFGTGTVVADDGEHVTVAFADAGTRRLKREFLLFE